MFNDLDLSELLNERDPAPSGADLEYDPVFTEMEMAGQGKPEQQYGDTIIEAEPPDWAGVKTHALQVLDRSHDLRAAVALATAALAVDGLVAFSSAIGLVRGYIDQRWETFNPVLDPDDDNDPAIRINALMSLCDVATTLRLLGDTPLVRARAVGQFGLRDWRYANQELAWPEDSEQPKPEIGLIQSAFQACEFDELEQIKLACEQLRVDVKAIEDKVTDYVGSAQSCNFETLVKELHAIDRLLKEQHRLRAPAAAEPETETAGQEADTDTPATAVAKPTAGGGAGLSVGSLVIKSRDEAIRALDKVCEYFERFEPSSPLPLLLRRARRLSTKSFLEIIRDISPDGMHQVASLGGLDDTSDSSPEPTAGYSAEPSSFSPSDDDDGGY